MNGLTILQLKKDHEKCLDLLNEMEVKKRLIRADRDYCNYFLNETGYWSIIRTQMLAKKEAELEELQKRYEDVACGIIDRIFRDTLREKYEVENYENSMM